MTYRRKTDTHTSKGESDEEYAERKAAAQKGTKGLGRMGTPRSAGKTPEEKAAAKLTSTARMFMRLMDDGKKTPPISKELKREIERLRKLEEEK